MYEFKELVGKTVTVKTISGIEIIAKLVAYDEESFNISLANPRLVVLAEEEVAVVPYTFTSKSEQLHLLREQFFSIDLSLENSSSDYDRLVSEQTANQ
tara:strand:- start:47 stop:340 length:294 start_codon:yes stop_codon:yes gene_type:complete